MTGGWGRGSVAERASSAVGGDAGFWCTLLVAKAKVKRESVAKSEEVKLIEDKG